MVVLADATADPEPDVHAFLTERIFPRQADVITVAELEGLLSGGDAAAQPGRAGPNLPRGDVETEEGSGK